MNEYERHLFSIRLAEAFVELAERVIADLPKMTGQHMHPQQVNGVMLAAAYSVIIDTLYRCEPDRREEVIATCHAAHANAIECVLRMA
jgi:hypothetical protein